MQPQEVDGARRRRVLIRLLGGRLRFLLLLGRFLKIEPLGLSDQQAGLHQRIAYFGELARILDRISERRRQLPVRSAHGAAVLGRTLFKPLPKLFLRALVLQLKQIEEEIVEAAERLPNRATLDQDLGLDHRDADVRLGAHQPGVFGKRQQGRIRRHRQLFLAEEVRPAGDMAQPDRTLG